MYYSADTTRIWNVKIELFSDMNLSPSQKVEEVIVVPQGFVADKVEITYTKSWYLFWTGNQWRVAYTIDVSDGEGNKKTARPTGNKLKTGEKQTLEFAWQNVKNVIINEKRE